jgi:hypothetical protein
VRESAAEAYRTRLVEGKAVEQVLTDGGEPLRQLLLDEEQCDLREWSSALLRCQLLTFSHVAEQDLALLSNPSSLLFAVEKPNIFRDFALTTSRLLPSFSIASSPDDMTRTRLQVAKLVEAVAAGKNLPAGPLGLTGNELVSRWANTLIRRLDAMGEAEDEAVSRLRPSM